MCLQWQNRFKYIVPWICRIIDLYFFFFFSFILPLPDSSMCLGLCEWVWFSLSRFDLFLFSFFFVVLFFFSSQKSFNPPNLADQLYHNLDEIAIFLLWKQSSGKPVLHWKLATSSTYMKTLHILIFWVENNGRRTLIEELWWPPKLYYYFCVCSSS